MSEKVSVAEQNAAKEFIISFVEKCGGIVYESVESLPKQSTSLHCSKDEIEGECLYIALEYLRNSGAPEIVATTAAHQTIVKLLKEDLQSFEEEISVFDKKTDSDEEDESKIPRKNIKAVNCGKLAIATINAVHDVCKMWKESMPTLYKSRNTYEVYSHSTQNTRRRMEDRHMVITEFNNLFGLNEEFPSQAYFAVFDGHGGVDCANYTVAHFHNNIAKQDEFTTDLDEALSKAFLSTDKHFTEKAKNENLRAGTTGVVAMLKGNTLNIGWLGDSQISLCKQGQAVELMQPHKPNRKDERKRIEDLGGCVIWIGDWRVNGNIAVSRSIGDKDHKPYVSADPDTREFDLEGDEEYLILGCDGLWDTIAAPEVIKMVQDHLSSGGSRSSVAKFLVDRAIEHGSTDNVSVIVVFLDCHRTVGEEAPKTTAAESASEGTGEKKSVETPGGTEQGHGEEKMVEN
ncbi:protein phosphatase 1F-like [Dendronephthya gigantea]|uniref:protein phosphatase 1F-like n=1 Tax=Dendronephthya gigantea TaxID=151771 RepID=UPI00106B50DD|nr:protein phosphatase 1F-like [Dendronephthya gigantea]